MDRLLQCVHQRVTRKPEVQKLDLHSILYSILFWSRFLDRNFGTHSVQTKEDRVGRNEEVIRLKLGTANVTTLYPREEESVGVSTRQLQLAQQLRKEEYQVFGLQETRVRRSAQFRCEVWLVWTAAAEAGRSGVEVWLDESPGMDARDVNPRCLAISVPFLSRRTLFVSAHGPVADAGEEQIWLWWDTFAAELVAAAQDQNVVLLMDASASLNDEAEATKENVAGTALEELVAERALCIPQTFSKFGLNWHAVVSDIKVEPPEMLAINDLMDHQAVTLTITLRQEKCQSRERRPNIECAANLTPEAKAQFESMWVQAPTPAIRALELIEQAMTTLAQETPQAVCPLGTPTPRQPWVTAHSWAELRIHSSQAVGVQSLAGCVRTRRRCGHWRE